MIKTLLSIFAKSPFIPLNSHMERVSLCVHQLKPLFEAIEQSDFAKAEGLVKTISELEHYADITKNDIRNHMPKGLYLPIHKTHLLDILALQDAIADTAQDIAVLTTFKNLTVLPSFRDNFHAFLNKNIETFDHAYVIIKELHELLESSFGGIEAEKVRSMVHQVAYKEHEVDLIQRKLLQDLFSSEKELTYTTFFLWDKIFQNIGNISNLSENLSNRVRMTLELKK